MANHVTQQKLLLYTQFICISAVNTYLVFYNKIFHGHGNAWKGAGQSLGNQDAVHSYLLIGLNFINIWWLIFIKMFVLRLIFTYHSPYKL